MNNAKHRLPVFLPHQLRQLHYAGSYAATRSHDALYPIIRCWFPQMSLTWFLTHSSHDNPDLVFGLSIQGSEHVYELGWWSIDAFEQFGRGPYETALRSTSVFSVHASIATYVRSAISRRLEKARQLQSRRA